MVQNKAIARRRRPRQERSRATVEAILEAGAQVLVEVGYDRASTNRIAKRAGVSVGTLYQYFPNKEALFAELLDRHTDELMQVIGAKLLAMVGEPLPIATRELVKVMLDAHRVNPELHRVFVETVEQLGLVEQIRDVTSRAATLVRTYLGQRKDELRVPDLDRATFIVVTCVEAITHNAVVSNPEYLADDSLLDETTELLLRYLMKDPP